MKDDSFKDFVVDQLGAVDGLVCRAMFGGYGLYLHGTFFGIIHKGRLYFRTNATTMPEYRKRGLKPFRPNPKQTLKTYYEVPVEILEDTDLLTLWVRRAVQPKNSRRS
jgi:DNA transformation protein